MNQKRFKIVDGSGDKKYFTMIPNYIVNHSTHYEQSLYLVMKRIAGEDSTCWASPITIGEKMGTSGNTVRKYLLKLEKRGWVRKIGQRGKTKPTNEYEVVDLWDINMKYYTEKDSSTGEQSKKDSSTGEKIVQLVSLVSSTGGNKEEPFKKNHEEDSAHGAGNTTNALISLFKGINPSYQLFFARPPQRAAADRLLKLHDFEWWQRFFEAYPKALEDRFCPRATSPIKLEEKIGDIEHYGRSQKQKEVKKTNIAFS